jgi:tRNA (guanine-N7-)-methyltransferase
MYELKTKTYGRRKGRMSKAEKEALERFLPMLQIPLKGIINHEKEFSRKAPLFVEIGFGNGSFLYQKALSMPYADFIGIEVYITGAAKLIRKMTGYDNTKEPTPSNIRIILEDARRVFTEYIPDSSVTGVYILFPDPWPKKRHHKRRLINPEFAKVLLRKLQKGGFVLVATDHKGYAEVIEESFRNAGFEKSKHTDLDEISYTKYAEKARAAHAEIYFFRFIKP